MFILLDKEGAGNKRPRPFQGHVVFMGMKILFKGFKDCVFEILLSNTLYDHLLSRWMVYMDS